jgi:hypothetical protein
VEMEEGVGDRGEGTVPGRVLEPMPEDGSPKLGLGYSFPGHSRTA